MSKTQYRALLHSLEISQERMAALLGIGKRTSQGYATGEPIPPPTSALLHALGEGKITVEDLERYGKKR
jgi:hypothetical protein